MSKIFVLVTFYKVTFHISNSFNNGMEQWCCNVQMKQALALGYDKFF